MKQIIDASYETAMKSVSTVAALNRNHARVGYLVRVNTIVERLSSLQDHCRMKALDRYPNLFSRKLPRECKCRVSNG